MGGNAAFLSGYNRRVTVRQCRIQEAGASGICVAGRSAAVRNPLETYSATLSLAELDRTPGPRTEDFPRECLVENCLIAATGRVEKQSAGVAIDMAREITVRHSSIYDVPRAGINIGDGCWGGHTVEGCDVFNTVLETSDHGAFNSWGRDRWWKLSGTDPDTLMTGPLRDLPTLDALLPNTLVNNRWACAHGWDIDLDDGSTNYRILGNLCLCGGIKLREGFLRVCENNVTVNNTLHVHVWPADSGDQVERNIFFAPYRPIRPQGWGAAFDNNFLHESGITSITSAVALQQLSGDDAHSLAGDARFKAPSAGDIGLQNDSPARQLGIKSLDVRYGVLHPGLRRLAKTPDIQLWLSTEPATLRSKRTHDAMPWMGAVLRNLIGLNEVSAWGAPGETGVIVESLSPDSAATQAGLRTNDLLLKLADHTITDTAALARITAALPSRQSAPLEILRSQAPLRLTLPMR